jgi:large subunit ribosomal protein L30
MSKANKLAVTLVRSPIARKPSHVATIAGLGLKRMHQTVELQDTPSIRGMINKVSYMLSVEETV